VIGCGGCAVYIEYANASLAEAIKRLWAGNLMNKMTVDEDSIRVPVSTFYNVLIPDLFKNCFRLRHAK
jgi:hypothetical protein